MTSCEDRALNQTTDQPTGRPRTLGGAAESCIAANGPLENRRFDA